MDGARVVEWDENVKAKLGALRLGRRIFSEEQGEQNGHEGYSDHESTHTKTSAMSSEQLWHLRGLRPDPGLSLRYVAIFSSLP